MPRSGSQRPTRLRTMATTTHIDAVTVGSIPRYVSAPPCTGITFCGRYEFRTVPQQRLMVVCARAAGDRRNRRADGGAHRSPSNQRPGNVCLATRLPGPNICILACPVRGWCNRITHAESLHSVTCQAHTHCKCCCLWGDCGCASVHAVCACRCYTFGGLWLRVCVSACL